MRSKSLRKYRSQKRQQDLFGQFSKRGRKPQKPPGHFGGMYLKKYNASRARPMDSKKALHVVLRSSRAVGVKSFKNKRYGAEIWDIISRNAKKAGVTIYEYANSGNHLHFLIRAKRRDEYRSFIRAITGVIARLVSGRERGLSMKEGGEVQPPNAKFWDGRPFSRVVSFARREFLAARSYVVRNILETMGWVPYVPRDRRLPEDIRRWLLISTATQVSGTG